MDRKDILFLEQTLSDFPVMIWKWDLARDTFLSSAHLANFLRKGSAARPLSMDGWIERAHPDDRQKLRNLREDLRIRHIDTFSLLYRTLDDQGAWRWVLSEGRVTARDPQGAPTEATGITLDQTRLKETEEKAIQGELKLTTIFETLDDLIFVCDSRGTLLKTNSPPLARELFGDCRLEGQDLGRMLLERGVSEHSLGQILSEDPATVPVSLTDRSGQTRFLEIKTRPGAWENQSSFFGILHDFSERKRALGELSIRREQLELALEGAEEGLWDYDLLSGKITFDNRSVLILELPHGNTSQFERNRDHVHPEDLPQLERLLKRHLRGLTPYFSVEYRILLPGNRTKWIHQRGRICRRDDLGTPLTMRGTIMDISEHKTAEKARAALQEKLIESEERLKLALEATEDGIWDWDIKNDKVFVSNHWVEMLGYTSEDIPPSAMVIFELMHPEDKEPALQKLRDHLEGKTPSYRAEFRALTKSGDWKWVLSRGKVISRNEDGSAQRIIGTQTDISSRISSHAKIEELEARLREVSSRDSLTGALNRQAFRRILNQEADRSLRHETPLTLILVNFDRFDQINSLYGNHVGDRILVEAARLISQTIRTTDNLARWSGEEFIILTPEKMRDSLALAEKLRTVVAGIEFPDLPDISASFGVAGYRAGEKPEDLLQRADMALYKAKKRQGNRVASQE